MIFSNKSEWRSRIIYGRSSWIEISDVTETSSRWDDDKLLLSELVFVVGVVLTVEGRMTSDWIEEFGKGGTGGIFDGIRGGGGGGGSGDCSIKSAGDGGKLSISEIVPSILIPIFNGKGDAGGGSGIGEGLADGLAIVCFIGGYCVIWWFGSNCIIMVEAELLE